MSHIHSYDAEGYADQAPAAKPKLAVDYCPFCCVSHVIGEHPREDETERDYWRRMNNAN